MILYDPDEFLLYSHVILAIEKLQDTEGSVPRRPITENTLFYGDNLFILLEPIPDESVDLIYLDPPF